MEHVNWGLIEDEIAIKAGKLPSALVSRDERRGRVKTLMAKMLGLAAKLNISATDLARMLGVARVDLYRWRDGVAVPGMKNYCELLRLCLALETKGTPRVVRFKPKPKARVAQQIIFLATRLGYKQYQVADALGVSKGTVSRWRYGEEEPNAPDWSKLLALMESLQSTGRLLIVSKSTASKQDLEEPGKLGAKLSNPYGEK